MDSEHYWCTILPPTREHALFIPYQRAIIVCSLCFWSLSYVINIIPPRDRQTGLIWNAML